MDVLEVDHEVVKYGQMIGLEIRAAAIRSREDVVKAEAGCNGITINWPDWLIEYVRNRGERFLLRHWHTM